MYWCLKNSTKITPATFTMAKYHSLLKTLNIEYIFHVFSLQCISSFMISPYMYVHMYILLVIKQKRAVYKQKVCCFAFFSFIAIKASCILSIRICFHRQNCFLISPKESQKIYLIKHANICHEKSLITSLGIRVNYVFNLLY